MGSETVPPISKSTHVDAPYREERFRREPDKKRILLTGSRQHKYQPSNTQRTRQIPQPHNLRRNRRSRRPKCARHHPAHEAKENQHTKALCKDPYKQTKHADEECHAARHVQPSDGVREVAYWGATKGLAEVENGADDAALLGGETDGAGVGGEGEEEDDVAEHAEDAEGEEGYELGFAEEGGVEADLSECQYEGGKLVMMKYSSQNARYVHWRIQATVVVRHIY